MKTLTFTVLFIISIITSLSAQSLDNFFTQTDKFLSKWVKEGNINYSMLKQNYDEIDLLYNKISNIDISNSSENEKKAFYINAYNLIVIHQISKHYPLKSALNKSGFFDKFKHKVAGESITLDYIEKKYLILKYKDPRVHFVLSCAAVSCPPLASFAIFPNQLEEKLSERTKFALSLKSVLKVDKGNNRILASKIFDWYSIEFDKSPIKMIQFINKYSNKNIPTNYDIDFMEYNWSVNDSNEKVN